MIYGLASIRFCRICVAQFQLVKVGWRGKNTTHKYNGVPVASAEALKPRVYREELEK